MTTSGFDVNDLASVLKVLTHLDHLGVRREGDLISDVI